MTFNVVNLLIIIKIIEIVIILKKSKMRIYIFFLLSFSSYAQTICSGYDVNKLYLNNSANKIGTNVITSTTAQMYVFKLNWTFAKRVFS